MFQDNYLQPKICIFYLTFKVKCALGKVRYNLIIHHVTVILFAIRTTLLRGQLASFELRKKIKGYFEHLTNWFVGIIKLGSTSVSNVQSKYGPNKERLDLKI